MNEHTAQRVCEQLGIDEREVVNIYPYGSRIYGCHTDESDHDYIIVFKRAILESGSFKDNAISSPDRTVQGTAYGRGGFQDAINNYMMPAMEAMSLDADQVIKGKWPFKVQKWNEREMIKSVVKQASSSWHIAHRRWGIEHKAKTGDPTMFMDRIKKGIWHSLRILMFGMQLRESGSVTDFTAANELHGTILRDEDFSTKKYVPLRDEFTKVLKDG